MRTNCLERSVELGKSGLKENEYHGLWQDAAIVRVGAATTTTAEWVRGAKPMLLREVEWWGHQCWDWTSNLWVTSKRCSLPWLVCERHPSGNLAWGLSTSVFSVKGSCRDTECYLLVGFRFLAWIYQDIQIQKLEKMLSVVWDTTWKIFFYVHK